MRDPRWEALCLPVLAMFNGPRTWRQLSAWYRANRYGGDKFRHCIAWLEEHRYIKSQGADDDVTWERTPHGDKFLAEKETHSDPLRHRRLGVPIGEVGLNGGTQPMWEDGRVSEEQAASNLRDDLALLGRDGVLGEKPLLIDGRLYERAHERLLESGVLGIAEKDFSKTQLTLTVEKAHRRSESPTEVEEVEQKVDVGLRKTAT